MPYDPSGNNPFKHAEWYFAAGNRFGDITKTDQETCEKFDLVVYGDGGKAAPPLYESGPCNYPDAAATDALLDYLNTPAFAPDGPYSSLDAWDQDQSIGPGKMGGDVAPDVKTVEDVCAYGKRLHSSLASAPGDARPAATRLTARSTLSVCLPDQHSQRDARQPIHARRLRVLRPQGPAELQREQCPAAQEGQVEAGGLTPPPPPTSQPYRRLPGPPPPDYSKYKKILKIVLPCVLLALIATASVLALYILRMKRKAKYRWILKRHEVQLEHPVKVLGQGADGDVVAAVFRGRAVAVKRMTMGTEWSKPTYSSNSSARITRDTSGISSLWKMPTRVRSQLPGAAAQPPHAFNPDGGDDVEAGGASVDDMSSSGGSFNDSSRSDLASVWARCLDCLCYNRLEHAFFKGGVLGKSMALSGNVSFASRSPRRAQGLTRQYNAKSYKGAAKHAEKRLAQMYASIFDGMGTVVACRHVSTCGPAGRGGGLT